MVPRIDVCITVNLYTTTDTPESRSLDKYQQGNMHSTYLYSSIMTKLRSIFQLRWWTLAWFALTLGVATLSPLVHAKSMEIVCSANGQFKLVLLGEQAPNELTKHQLDCPLCILADAPPSIHRTLSPLRVSGTAPTPHVFPVQAVAATAAPPPARGPPLFPRQS